MSPILSLFILSIKLSILSINIKNKRDIEYKFIPCRQDDYKTFMRYIDIKGQFDSEYNMPYEIKPVNNTNTSVSEKVGTAMGMHPSSEGYNQIGDAFFRALMSN